MSVRNTENSWGAIARALHWVIALYVFGMLIDGYWMDHFVPRADVLGQRLWHATFGVYFGLLVALRVIWRLANRPPEDVPGMAGWERLLSRLVHGLIYLLIIIIPIAGWITWSARERHLSVSLPWGGQIPWGFAAPNRALSGSSETVHVYMAYTLLGLVALHVAAALWHHFVRRDAVLTRMTQGHAA